MNRMFEILMVIAYNLTLLAGASYLVYYKDASAWLFVLAIMFAASWENDSKTKTRIDV